MEACEAAWEPPPVQACLETWDGEVAGKPTVDMPPGTLNSVLKQAGLK